MEGCWQQTGLLVRANTSKYISDARDRSEVHRTRKNHSKASGNGIFDCNARAMLNSSRAVCCRKSGSEGVQQQRLLLTACSRLQ